MVFEIKILTKPYYYYLFLFLEAKLKAIWKNLRNIFQRELRKNYSRSTSVYRGKWKYFQTMSFLIVKGDDNDNDEGDEYPIEFVEENDFEDQNGEEMYTDDDDYNCTNSDNCPIASDQEIDPVESITDADVRREENNTDSIKENGNLIYDVMFLKSLAPFFKQLVPMRKLIMRSKIQDLLLKEIADQNASNSSET